MDGSFTERRGHRGPGRIRVEGKRHASISRGPDEEARIPRHQATGHDPDRGIEARDGKEERTGIETEDEARRKTQVRRQVEIDIIQRERLKRDLPNR